MNCIAFNNLLPKLKPILQRRRARCERADYLERIYNRRVEIEKLYGDYLENSGVHPEVKRFMPSILELLGSQAAKKLVKGLEGDAKTMVTRESWHQALQSGLQQYFEDFVQFARAKFLKIVDGDRAQLALTPLNQRPPWFAIALANMTVDGATAFLYTDIHVEADIPTPGFGCYTIGEWMQEHRDEFPVPTLVRSSRLGSQRFAKEMKCVHFEGRYSLIAGALLMSMR
jgi:hypothetical protein